MKLILENYYQILGIPEYASRAQIQTAYQALARMMKRSFNSKPIRIGAKRVDPEIISEAYQTLIDPKNRKEYDKAVAHYRRSMKDAESTEAFPIMSPVDGLTYPERLYHYGLRAMDRCNYNRAIVHFKKLLTLEKDNPMILRLISIAHRYAGAHAFAIKSAQEAVELEPENEENFLVLGMALEAKGKLAAAQRCYNNAYKMNPNNPLAQKQYGRGSLVGEKVLRGMIWFLKCFLPDPKARTLRYQDGVLTKEHIRRFFGRSKSRGGML